MAAVVARRRPGPPARGMAAPRRPALAIVGPHDVPPGHEQEETGPTSAASFLSRFAVRQPPVGEMPMKAPEAAGYADRIQRASAAAWKLLLRDRAIRRATEGAVYGLTTYNSLTREEKDALVIGPASLLALDTGFRLLDAACATASATWDDIDRLCALCGAASELVAAKDEFMRRNVKLVASIVGRRPGAASSPDVEDMLQEGCIAMMRAAQTFDPSRGAAFATYAAFSIKQAVQRYRQNHGYTMRTAVQVHQDRATIMRRSAIFEAKHGRPPTDEELGALCKLKPARIREARALSSTSYLSLDAPASGEDAGEGGSPLAGAIGSGAPGADELLMEHETNAAADADVRCLLDRMPVRGRAMVRMYYGLGTPDGSAMTLQQIGDSFGLSRERVRQIIVGAMKTAREAGRRE